MNKLAILPFLDLTWMAKTVSLGENEVYEMILNL